MGTIVLEGVSTPGYVERLVYEEKDIAEVLKTLAQLGFKGMKNLTPAALEAAAKAETPAALKIVATPPEQPKVQEPAAEKKSTKKAKEVEQEVVDEDEVEPPKQKTRAGGEKKTRSAQDDADVEPAAKSKIDLKVLLETKRLGDIVERILKQTGTSDAKEVVRICVELRDVHKHEKLKRDDMEADVEQYATALLSRAAV